MNTLYIYLFMNHSHVLYKGAFCCKVRFEFLKNTKMFLIKKVTIANKQLIGNKAVNT